MHLYKTNYFAVGSSHKAGVYRLNLVVPFSCSTDNSTTTHHTGGQPSSRRQKPCLEHPLARLSHEPEDRMQSRLLQRFRNCRGQNANVTVIAAGLRVPRHRYVAAASA